MSVHLQPHEPLFARFNITAHRSLSDAALRRILIIGGTAGIAFDLTLFIAFGAVVGIITLFDLLFLGLALSLHQRGARSSEEISVASNGLFIRRVLANGVVQEIAQFTLYGLEVTSVEDADGEIRRIAVGSRGRRITIGQALLPNERSGFRDALLKSLADAGARPVHRRDIDRSASAAYAGS